MQPKASVLTCLLFAACCFTMAGCAATTAKSGEPTDVPILQQWAGDYPVDHLATISRVPHKSAVGFIGDATGFAAAWQVFRPGETIPEVNFDKHFIVFYRNVDFYNRTSIAKVILKDGNIEILAMETMSSRPIEDKVALSMAVIPRAGIESIATGNERIVLPEAK